MSNVVPLDTTIAYVVNFVRQHPGARQSAIVTRTHEVRKRREIALAVAVARGHLVRSEKRPITYSIPKGQETQCFNI